VSFICCMTMELADSQHPSLSACRRQAVRRSRDVCLHGAKKTIGLHSLSMSTTQHNSLFRPTGQVI